MSSRDRFVRPYMVAHYPCSAADGGCGAAVGALCTTKNGTPTANPHTARWRAHDRARGGPGRAVATRELPDIPGTLVMLRGASRALAQARDLLARALDDLDSAP
jgi:hypothetical protein